MNIRIAILKAADSIERNPESYAFFQGDKLIGDSPRGCMLVWIGHFAGVEQVSRYYSDDVAQYLGLRYLNDFTSKCCKLITTEVYDNPVGATAVLRKYADKYHPVQGIPESILTIFNEKAVA